MRPVEIKVNPPFDRTAKDEEKVVRAGQNSKTQPPMMVAFGMEILVNADANKMFPLEASALAKVSEVSVPKVS